MASSSKKGSSARPRRTRKGKDKASAPETGSAGFNNEDYDTRSPERTELLTKIKDIINDVPVSPAFWACSQLGDMNRLQVIANSDRPMLLTLQNPLAVIALQYELLGL